MSRAAALAGALAICAIAAPAAQADDCPNAALRTGPAAALPDCRAWEQVSPVDKAGSNVAPAQDFEAAPDGSGIVFDSSGAFAGAESNAVSTRYLGRRRADGWTVRGVDPPEDPIVGFGNAFTLAVSDDLSKALMSSTRALAPGAVPGQGNVYVRDLATGGYTTIATSSDPHFIRSMVAFGAAQFNYVGATPNFSHVVFLSTVALTPDAIPDVNNMYEWDGSALRVVDQQPAGGVDPAGARGQLLAWQRDVSADGRQIVFGNYGGAPFLRRDGATTVPVSVSQRPGDPTTPAPADFQVASADGSVVYFTSVFDLTPASDTQSSPTLYRYDVASGTLTDLTATSGASVLQALGTSTDGSFVYFEAQAILAPGATSAANNIYLWHAGHISYVTTLSEFLPEGWSVSPNGHHLVLESYSRLTSFDNVHSSSCPADPALGNPDGACKELYAYNSDDAQLTCVSCNATGAPPAGNVGMGLTVSDFGGYLPRAVIDGGEVFFDTPDPLVVGDENGRRDVYRYKPGDGVRLISSGQGTGDAVFSDASADGRDVFFTTSDPLVDRDTDHLVDLYDARVDGGFAGQQSDHTLPCAGVDCRGSAQPRPDRPQPGSADYAGPGNAHPPARRPAPTFRVTSLSKAARATLARTGRATLSVRVDAAGTVSLTARATLRGHARTVGSSRTAAHGRGTVHVTLRLSAAARRELRRTRRLKLSLSFVYSKASDPKSLVLTLSAPKRHGK